LPLYFRLLPHHPSPTLFPYTTLFRSIDRPTRKAPGIRSHPISRITVDRGSSRGSLASRRCRAARSPPIRAAPTNAGGTSMCATRSEEHTSELQSLAYLVCRLLLEKKN